MTGAVLKPSSVRFTVHGDIAAIETDAVDVPLADRWSSEQLIERSTVVCPDHVAEAVTSPPVPTIGYELTTLSGYVR